MIDDRPDPAQWAEDCLTEIDAWYQLSKSVENRVRRLIPPRATDPGEDGCMSCGRLAHNWVPVHRGGRCRWCYEFWLTYKVDPPLVLVEARKEGRRITDRMVNEAMGRRSA